MSMYKLRQMYMANMKVQSTVKDPAEEEVSSLSQALDLSFVKW